jgi:hypothetical protein
VSSPPPRKPAAGAAAEASASASSAASADNAAPPRVHGDQDRQRYLREFCDLLWPSPAMVTFAGPALGRAGTSSAGASSAGAGGGSRGTQSEFILLLGMRRPRLLIPAARRASAAAVRGYGEPGSRTAQLGSRVLSVALASGLGGAMLRSRIRVHAPPGTETIESFLREALGRDLLISAYLGPARANRKPVLQLLSSRGQPAGFAKIGTSPLTRALVQAERDALTRLGQAGLTDVTVPRVLHYGEWREMNVLVLSALPVWLRRRPVDGAQLDAAMKSVAGVGGRRGEPLAAGSYWQRLTSRLAAADESAERDTLLGALAALSARAGDAQLALGSWHGDWTPWNMASTSGGLLVWDWERFTDGVPLGFDALHYRLQRDVVPGQREPRAAAAACIEDAPGSLAAFGLSASEARITGILYLADLATRYLADRQAQAGAVLGAPGRWLIPAITDQVSRL